jgi:Bacterial Ig domain
MPTPQELILGPQAVLDQSWFTQTQLSVGRALGTACPPSPPTDAVALNNYTINLQYYDLPLCLYICHARTGDPQLKTLADNAADSYWQHPWIGSGRTRPWPDQASPPPRHANVGGLILRALDDRPIYWDWLVEYTKAALNTWVMLRINNAGLHNGVREGAFALHHAVWLSQALPDSYPLQAGGMATNGAVVRAQLLADAERAATGYFGRLQQPDGSWRWNDFDASDGPFVGIMQPFMVGLLLSALADLHQVTTNATVKASVAAQIVTAARHLALDGPFTRQWVAGMNAPLDGFHYFYHGGTQAEPTRYVKGSYPPDWNTTDPSDVQNGRQAIGPIIQGIAYAATLATDAKLKADLTAAVATMWEAAYGSNPIHNYMRAGDGKSYCQNARRAGSVLALLEMGQPTPAPQPEPAPAPSPTPPTPAPGVPVAAITSPVAGAKVSGVVTVTATAEDAAGISTVYLIVDGVVSGPLRVAPYTFKLDSTKLNDGNHVIYVRAWNTLGKAGDSAKVTLDVWNAVPAPAPTPTPDPLPPPQPQPCAMSVSPGELSLPVNGMSIVTVKLEGLTKADEIQAVVPSGQVSVNPGIMKVPAGITSFLAPFQVRVKRKGGTITFKSGCGSKVVTVKVG